jgi:DNA-binding IclR family transcriptional regulator
MKLREAGVQMKSSEDLITAYLETHPAATRAKDIAVATGLPIGTVRNVCLDLYNRGWLTRSYIGNSHHYEVTP